MGTAGEPRLDLGRLVGGVVVHDDMDLEPFGDASIDLLEEVQELGRPVSLVALADDETRCDIECCEQRGRAVPHVIVATGARVRQASSAKPAAPGSSAWIWLFSSMLRTSARLGGER